MSRTTSRQAPQSSLFDVQLHSEAERLRATLETVTAAHEKDLAALF